MDYGLVALTDINIVIVVLDVSLDASLDQIRRFLQVQHLGQTDNVERISVALPAIRRALTEDAALHMGMSFLIRFSC